MARYDIAILGTGPAGVSAAITAKIRNKNILLLGSANLSDKLQKAHAIQNYPGLPDIPGAELAAAFRRHLDQLGIAITEEKVSAVYSMGDYFALQTTSNQMYEASAVILAAGVTAGRLLPGEAELLGQGVSYCATCDAPLYRGKTAAVIGYSPREEAEADFLSEIASRVLYFPQYKAEPHLREGVEVVRETPVSISRGEHGKILTTNAGSYEVNGVFVLRESVFPGQLVPGLATEGNRVAVDRLMATNIPGCFACGDLVGQPYQYVKAAGEGNVAALSAVSWLDARARA